MTRSCSGVNKESTPNFREDKKILNLRPTKKENISKFY